MKKMNLRTVKAISRTQARRWSLGWLESWCESERERVDWIGLTLFVINQRTSYLGIDDKKVNRRLKKSNIWTNARVTCIRANLLLGLDGDQGVEFCKALCHKDDLYPKHVSSIFIAIGTGQQGALGSTGSCACLVVACSGGWKRLGSAGSHGSADDASVSPGSRQAW